MDDKVQDIHYLTLFRKKKKYTGLWSKRRDRYINRYIASQPGKSSEAAAWELSSTVEEVFSRWKL